VAAVVVAERGGRRIRARVFEFDAPVEVDFPDLLDLLLQPHPAAQRDSRIDKGHTHPFPFQQAARYGRRVGGVDFVANVLQMLAQALDTHEVPCLPWAIRPSPAGSSWALGLNQEFLT